MSIHPSFKSGKSKTQKTVLKRLEKILRLQKEEKWDEEKDSIFGLPKVKVTKLKFKKEKKEAVPEAAAGAAGETAAGVGGKPSEGAGAKAAEKKSGEDKKDKKIASR